LRSLRGETACVFPELPGKEDKKEEEGVVTSAADWDSDTSLADGSTPFAKLLTTSPPQSTGENKSLSLRSNPYEA